MTSISTIKTATSSTRSPHRGYPENGRSRSLREPDHLTSVSAIADRRTHVRLPFALLPDRGASPFGDQRFESGVYFLFPAMVPVRLLDRWTVQSGMALLDCTVLFFSNYGPVAQPIDAPHSGRGIAGRVSSVARHKGSVWFNDLQALPQGEGQWSADARTKHCGFNSRPAHIPVQEFNPYRNIA